MPFIRRSVQSSSAGVTEASVPRRPRLCPLLRPPRFLPDLCPSSLVATTPPAAGWWWLQTATRVVGGRSAELPRDAAPPRPPRPPHLAATRGSGSCPPPPLVFFSIFVGVMVVLSVVAIAGRPRLTVVRWLALRRRPVRLCGDGSTHWWCGLWLGTAMGGRGGGGGGNKGGGVGGRAWQRLFFPPSPSSLAGRSARRSAVGGAPVDVALCAPAGAAAAWSARRRRPLRSVWSCGRRHHPGHRRAVVARGNWAPGVSVLREAPRPPPPDTVATAALATHDRARAPTTLALVRATAVLVPRVSGHPPPREANEGRGGREGDEPRLGTRGTSPRARDAEGDRPGPPNGPPPDAPARGRRPLHPRPPPVGGRRAAATSAGRRHLGGRHHLGGRCRLGGGRRLPSCPPCQTTRSLVVP